MIAIETLEILLAIEKLEYHDKNWLHINCADNPKRWSEKKQELIESTLQYHALKPLSFRKPTTPAECKCIEEMVEPVACAVPQPIECECIEDEKFYIKIATSVDKVSVLWLGNHERKIKYTKNANVFTKQQLISNKDIQSGKHTAWPVDYIKSIEGNLDRILISNLDQSWCYQVE